MKGERVELPHGRLLPSFGMNLFVFFLPSMLQFRLSFVILISLMFIMNVYFRVLIILCCFFLSCTTV